MCHWDVSSLPAEQQPCASWETPEGEKLACISVVVVVVTCYLLAGRSTANVLRVGGMSKLDVV